MICKTVKINLISRLTEGYITPFLYNKLIYRKEQAETLCWTQILLTKWHSPVNISIRFYIFVLIISFYER